MHEVVALYKYHVTSKVVFYVVSRTVAKNIHRNNNNVTHLQKVFAILQSSECVRSQNCMLT